MPIDPKTTLRKIQFAVAYIKHLDTRKAAEVCDIPLSTAHGYMDDPFVRDKLVELARKAATRLELTVDEVIADLRENVSIAREKGDIKASNEALKLLGTYLKMFKETPDVIADNRKIIVFGAGTAVNSSGGPTPNALPDTAIDVTFRDGVVEGVPHVIAQAE